MFSWRTVGCYVKWSPGGGGGGVQTPLQSCGFVFLSTAPFLWDEMNRRERRLAGLALHALQAWFAFDIGLTGKRSRASSQWRARLTAGVYGFIPTVRRGQKLLQSPKLEKPTLCGWRDVFPFHSHSHVPSVNLPAFILCNLFQKFFFFEVLKENWLHNYRFWLSKTKRPQDVDSFFFSKM